MTPAEYKFSDVEGGLMRAQSLVRVLRNVFECGPDNADSVFWGGVHVLVNEADSALNEAAENWTQAHDAAIAARRP